MSTLWESVLTTPVTPQRDHVRGRVGAPLTLVEYGDYECPFCAAAHPVTEEIIARADDELLFTYRHFPMSTIHPHATTAAEAAEAAGSQRRFWEMHALLFADQHRLEPVDLVARADALRLDVNRFVEELRSRAHNPKVRSDFLSGVRSGVNGTPTFFVNGRRHDGPADLTSLLAALRDAKQRPEKITGPGGEGHAQRRRAAAGVGQPRPAPGAPRPPGRS